jgi:hypothetical protein
MNKNFSEDFGQKSRRGLFALRRGAAKVGRATRDTMACIAIGGASIAVTVIPAIDP